jgi:hypothetical protein
MAKAGVARFQVEIDENQMRELEQLAELGGLRTKKDLLNNALTLLKWAARQKTQGNAILTFDRDAGVYRELEMPFLESLASFARRKTDREQPEFLRPEIVGGRK